MNLPDPFERNDADIGLLVHGVAIRFQFDDPELLHGLILDYGRFRLAHSLSGTEANLRLRVVHRSKVETIDGLRRGPGGSLVRVGPDGADIVYASEVPRRAYEAEIRPYLTTLLSRYLLEQGDALMFHASAVCDDRGASLFVGQKAAGKTTMAMTALSAGARYMANDLVFVGGSSEHPQVLAMPQPPRYGSGTLESLRGRGLTVFDRPGADQRVDGVSPNETATSGQVRKASCDPEDLPRAPLDAPLRRVFFPWPDFDRDIAVLDPISQKEAAVILLQQCRLPFKPGLEPEASHRDLTHRVLTAIDAILAHAEIYRLRWSSSGERNIDLLRQALDLGAADPLRVAAG